jgi:hypothetical protein
MTAARLARPYGGISLLRCISLYYYLKYLDSETFPPSTLTQLLSQANQTPIEAETGRPNKRLALLDKQCRCPRASFIAIETNWSSGDQLRLPSAISGAPMKNTLEEVNNNGADGD